MSDSSNDKTNADVQADSESTIPADSSEKESKKVKPKPDPVRRLTKIVLYVCLILFVWHILSDRIAPHTDQARVRGFIVPIAPKVSGTVVEVAVKNNQAVKSGDVMAKIDPHDYEIAVESAKADVDSTGQTLGVETAAIKSAAARLADEVAQLERARQDFERVNRIKKLDPGAVAKSELDRVTSGLAQAESQVAGAEAELEKARQKLGKRGRDNPKMRAAVAALEKAQLNLKRTTLYAPSDGGITNLELDIGHYAKAGYPLITFMSISAVWIQANMRENSIGRIEPGKSVDIALDVAPGRIFRGEVVSVGFGVDDGQKSAMGALPTIKTKSGWLRDSQRIPVIIKFADEKAYGLRRPGGQADVVVYTGNNWILNPMSWLWIRLLSILSYVY